MSKYWFSNDEQKKCIVPFENISKEVAYCHRLEDYNVSYKQEVLDDRQALRNVSQSLIIMLVSARKRGKIILDEEDCEFLFNLASKKVQLDFSKLQGENNVKD